MTPAPFAAPKTSGFTEHSTFYPTSNAAIAAATTSSQTTEPSPDYTENPTHTLVKPKAQQIIQ